MVLKIFISILLITQTTYLAQICKLTSEKEGYCRQKGDCLAVGTGGGDGGCESGLECCQSSEKSVKKCRDYGEMVYKKGFGEALTMKSSVRRVSECGIEAVPLVVGGTKAKAKEFPHMVAIGFGDDVKGVAWMCGGTLISENFVLTAAHCSESRDRGYAKIARLGALNVGKPGSKVQDFTIIQRIVHPKYQPPSRYHDIALFKLSASVRTGPHVRPACLHVSPDEFAFKKAVATGWGKLSYSDSKGSLALMKVSLSLIDYSKCNASFSADVGGKSLRGGIAPWQLCAGELSGGKDTCQGDSGGPLQVVKGDPRCTYSIIGITSFGKFCGFKNSPAIYTRVSYYVPWIESIVWP